MRLFSVKNKTPVSGIQLRRTETHPFGMLDSYVPLGGGDIRLYRSIREAVPVVDAAIIKLIRLTGGFSVRCDDAGAERELNAFVKTVNVGRGQRGLNAFIAQYVELEYTGTAPTVGYSKLLASAAGKVKADSDGAEFLVLKVDTTNKIVGFIM